MKRCAAVLLTALTLFGIAAGPAQAASDPLPVFGLPTNPITSGTASIAGLALSVFASGVLGGAGSALRETAHVISQTTSPRLRSTWFSSTYWRVAGLAALLSLPFLFAAATQAILRGDLTLLARSAFGYLPLALIGVNLAAPITMLLLAATDGMSSVVAGAGMGGGVHFLQQTAQEIVGLSALDGSTFLAIAIGLLTLAAAVALAVEMLIREAAVYIVVLMLPLALAALIWPARRTWAVRLVELLIALILSKFVIVAVLSLAGAAYGASGSATTTRLLTAMTLVMLSTFAPWVMLRLLPFTEVAAGAVGGMRGELSRAARVPQEAASAAGAAASWAESLPNLLKRQAGEPGSDDSLPLTEADHAQGASGPVARLPRESGDGDGSTEGARAAAPDERRERLPGMEPRWQLGNLSWEDVGLSSDGITGSYGATGPDRDEAILDPSAPDPGAPDPGTPDPKETP